jgi:hypothetical protein
LKGCLLFSSAPTEPVDVNVISGVILQDVRQVIPNFKGGLNPAVNVMGCRLVQQYVPMWAKEIARRFLRY